MKPIERINPEDLLLRLFVIIPKAKPKMQKIMQAADRALRL